MMHSIIIKFLLIVGILNFGSVQCLIAGGWASCEGGSIENDAVNLGRKQYCEDNAVTPGTLDVISCEYQIVAGTNVRLVFKVDNSEKCTLTAFKPLPYTKKPIQVKSFLCDHILDIPDDFAK